MVHRLVLGTFPTPFDHLWRRKPEIQRLISYYCSIILVIYIHIHALKTTPIKWDQLHGGISLIASTARASKRDYGFWGPVFPHAVRSWLSVEIASLWIMWKIIHDSRAWWSRDRGSGKPFGKITRAFCKLTCVSVCISCIGQQNRFKIISVDAWSDEKFILMKQNSC